MTGRMVCLLPGGPLMTGVPGSKLSYVLDDIQEKFEESIRVNVRSCFCTCGFSFFTEIHSWHSCFQRSRNLQSTVTWLFKVVIWDMIWLQEEGIVVKAADAPWRCNDRGLSWLKIKADYVHKVEIDAVIIGAKFGTGRRGGAISEYLLALAEVPQGGATEPSSFVSFCV